MKTSKCAVHINWKTPQLPSVLSQAGADLVKTITCIILTSGIDYTNSILYGSNDYDLKKLLRLQNTAARLIKGAKKNDHIMPILEELHWLPIRYRIQFKILLLVYKVFMD